MADDAKVILYIGILYLAYITMKSWGIVSASSMNSSNWKPLTTNELRALGIYYKG